MSPTVLVIDDDPDIREAVTTGLENQGYRVLVAPDGESGLARAVQEKPGLIIVDMMMPRASGFVVVERLKQQTKFRVPIIMLSGSAGGHQRTYAEFLGVDRFLCKPIRFAELNRAVSQLCPMLAATEPAHVIDRQAGVVMTDARSTSPTE